MMANISLTTPTDWSAQQQEIDRRRKLAELLQQQSMEPIQQFSSNGVPAQMSWTQGLAKMLQSYNAGQGIKEADEKQKSLASDFQRTGNEALIKGLQAYKGTAAQPEIPSPADELGGGPGREAMPAVAANPEAAMGIWGGHPMTQGASQAMLAQLLKGEEPYSLKQGETRMKGNQVVATNAPKPTEHVINGKVYASSPDGTLREVGGPGMMPTPNHPFNPDGTPNPAYQEYELKKANAGSTRLQTNVNSYLPASEEAQRDFIKSTRTTYDTLKQVPVALKSIEEAKALIPQAKGFMGPGGESLLSAAKFLNNRLGTNINTEGVKGAEELRTRIFFNIMDNLKKMDAQPSQQQQQIMQEALGRLGTDPNALPSVLDAFAEVMKGKVNLHNQEVQGAVQRGVKFPYDPTIKLPEIGQAQSAESVPTATGPNGQKLYLRNGQWSTQ